MNKALGRAIAITTIAAASAAAPLAAPAQAAPAPAGEATVQSCYGDAKPFRIMSGARVPGQGWLYTTSSCADINIRPTGTKSVRVCFQRTTCNSWKTAYANQWNVIATNVVDGAAYAIETRTAGYFDGYRAD